MRIKETQDLDKQYMRWFPDAMCISYEDLSENLINISDDICTYLNLYWRTLRPAIVKNPNAQPEKVITNYSEIMQLLKQEGIE